MTLTIDDAEAVTEALRERPGGSARRDRRPRRRPQLSSDAEPLQRLQANADPVDDVVGVVEGVSFKPGEVA